MVKIFKVQWSLVQRQFEDSLNLMETDLIGTVSVEKFLSTDILGILARLNEGALYMARHSQSQFEGRAAASPSL